MRRRAAQLAWIAMLVALAAPAHASAAEHAVAAGPGLTFAPQTVKIAQGDSVTWTNAGGLHNVHFEDESFVQPPFVSPDPWSATRSFGTAGSFRYYCDIHRQLGMTGTVDVSGADPGADHTAGPQADDSGSASGPATSQQAPAAGGCVSQRRFTIRLRGLAGLRIRSARIQFNGKQVAVRRQAIDGLLRHTAEIDMRGLPKGSYAVAITVVTGSGDVLRGTRTYRTCAGKLAPAKLPDL